MKNTRYQLPNTEYSEHFQKLSAKGNWQTKMDGATHRFTALASPSVFARQNLLYLESIVIHHNTPKGFRVHRRDYNSYQIVYTLSGTGLLQYNDREFALEAGSCFLIDCRKEHLYFTVGDEVWVHHGLQFNGHQMNAFCDYLERNNSIAVTLNNRDEINRLHEQLAAAAASKLASADFIINQLLTELLDHIILSNQLTSDAQLSPKIAEICNYIDGNYSNIRCIEDIARSCFISKFYMCREFKRQTGKTVGVYLTERRINAAKMLLLNSASGVSDIARASGFASENYFFSVFKKTEGITPLQYRKQFCCS